MRMFALTAAFIAVLTSSVPAHHATDAAASGLGGLAPTADLMEAGAVQLSWGVSTVFYPELKDEQLKAEVQAAGGRAALLAQDYVMTQTLGLSAGLLPWLQASVSLGSIRVERLREGHLHGNGSYGAHDFGSPQGSTDTELSLKAGHALGEHGRLALSLGGTLPTGRDDVLNDSISIDATANTTTGKVTSSPKVRYLGLGSQPGGGNGEFNLALAWSQDLSPAWTLDLGAQARLTQAYRGYRAGNQHQGGVALRWRYNEEPARSSLGLGLGFSQADQANSNGVGSQDSGGWALQVGPQWTQALGQHILIHLGGSLPLSQSLNGLQQKPVAKANGGISVGF